MAHRQTRNAKEAIKKAMFELMATQPYMDVTVADLARTAGVARVTFYRNFGTTSDVVDAIAQDFSNEFFETVLPALTLGGKHEWRRVLHDFFYRMSAYQQIFETIDPRNVTALASRMDAAVRAKDPCTHTTPVAEKYGAIAKFGIVNSVAKHWMDTGMRETIDEMVDYTLELISRL